MNGVNPFYLIQTAEKLFDQSDLSPNQRFFPLYRFQRTCLILAALYRFLKIAAPSQGGKTTVAEVIAAVMAYAFPGENVLILSTRQEQSERLLRDTRNKLIKRCTVEELRKLSTDSSTTLEIAATGSQIIALPHSINALTGNPARTVILDEMAKWDKEPAKIYAEAVARTGATGGNVICISSFFGEGTADRKLPQGFRGSFFHYNWKHSFADRHNPTKTAVAVKFTYHVSPPLVAKISELKSEMESSGEGFFNEHYLCIPRASTGRAVFEHEFKRAIHIRQDLDIPVNGEEPLFLCFDPGLDKAAVLGQLDPDALRLIYLRDYRGTREQSFEDFVKTVIIKHRREFPEFYVQYFADVASKKLNDQTLVSNAEIIMRLTGQSPVMEYQNVEPGIDCMKSFMRRVDGFYVSDKCTNLIPALEGGLVYEERNGVLQPRWQKDGEHEHVGDAARYPVHYLTGGMTADSLAYSGGYEVTQMPGTNPITGY